MSHTYESIALLHSSEAEEALSILRERGEAAALEHLKQWHEPGEGTLVSTRDNPWRPDDEVYEQGQFVMYYNADTPSIGLVCKINLDPRFD